MSLERKDVRSKLDPELHAALDAICNEKGVTQADWIESVIAPVLREKVAETMRLADEFRRRGIVGNDRDSQAGRR